MAHTSGDTSKRLRRCTGTRSSGEYDEAHTVGSKDEVVPDSFTMKGVSPGFKSSFFSFKWTFSRKKASNGYLIIPKCVAVAQDLQNKTSVALRDSNGKCWALKVCNLRRHVALTGGLSDFWEAQVITEGDHLSFTFVSECVIQVTINRGKPLEKANEETIECEEDRESQASVFDQSILSRSQRISRPRKYEAEDGIYESKGAKVSITGNSVRFTISFDKRKTHQFKHVSLPKAVSIKMKLSSINNVVLQDANGNVWPVKLVHKGDGRNLFSLGWRDFLADNKISAGDVVKFQFISDTVVQFHVTRTSTGECHSEDSECESEASGSLDFDGGYKEPDSTATSIDEVVPGFVTTNGVSSFSFMWTFWRKWASKNYLDIPKDVALVQNLENKTSVVLRDPGGKCWPLKVSNWHGHVHLTKGWSEFRKGHGITEGDHLSFEFISESIIQVTINRDKPLEEANEETVNLSR